MNTSTSFTTTTTPPSSTGTLSFIVPVPTNNSNTTANNVNNDDTPCCKKCKNSDENESNPLRKCDNSRCNIYSHKLCYEVLFSKKDWYTFLPSNHSDKVVYCNLACVTAAKKNNKEILYQWHNDGKDGEDDGNNSERILLDWLTEQGNWIKYKGKNNSGKTKLRYSKEIANIINSYGVKVVRTAEIGLNRLELV